jgi:hypothetical protein
MTDEQAMFWASAIRWALIHDPADRNLDLLPTHFHIDFGCPECGAAWTDLLAVGYASQRLFGGRANWSRAARLACFSGHSFNYDSYTGSIQRYRPPSWATTVAAYALKSGLIGKAS